MLIVTRTLFRIIQLGLPVGLGIFGHNALT